MDTKRLLTSLPFLVLIAVLPFPGTVALRLFCLAAAFAIALLNWKRFEVPPVPMRGALATWASVAFISLTYAVDPAYSLSEIKNELGYTTLIFVAFFAATRDERELMRMLLALSTGAIVLCVWALTNRVDLGYWYEKGGYGGSGSFATYLVAVAPIVALAGLYFDRAAMRVLSLALLALLLVTGFFCAQRAIWPVLFIQVCVALLLYRKVFGLRFTRVAGTMVVLALLSGGLLALTQTVRFKETKPAYAEMSNDTRLAVWPKLGRRILARPWSGAGFGIQAMAKLYPDLIPSENPLMWHAHNVVLNYGVAMGIPGMAALLLVFGALLREYMILSRSADRRLKMIGVCGIALVVGVLSRNMVNDFFGRDGALLFWALNGMLLGMGRRLRDQVTGP